jgi:hypothetical protein
VKTFGYKYVKSACIYTIAYMLVLGFASCVSMSSMQTARVVDEDDILATVGFGSTRSEFMIGTLDTLVLKQPFVEVAGRYGMGDNIDVGAKLTIIGTGIIDGKYQFYGDNQTPIALSAGLGLGFLKLKIGEAETNYVDVILPFYASYHPLTWVSLYSSPKYVLRVIPQSSDKKAASSTSHWYGGTVGIKLGKKGGVLLEYSFFGSTITSRPFSQVTAGFCFSID